MLVATHVSLLLTAEFATLPGRSRVFYAYTEFGLLMTALPLAGIVGGRYWPYLTVLPIVMAPIAGKTLRAMSYATDDVPPSVGWMLFVALPLTITLLTAIWLLWRGLRGERAHRFAAAALMVNSCLFFALNTVIFDYAWPWREWTFRTPNQLLFGIGTIALSVAALVCWHRPVGVADRDSESECRGGFFQA